MITHKQLIEAILEYSTHDCGLRKGQILFNALHDVDESLANTIRTTHLDPYYLDERISDCLDSIAFKKEK